MRHVADYFPTDGFGLLSQRQTFRREPGKEFSTHAAGMVAVQDKGFRDRQVWPFQRVLDSVANPTDRLGVERASAAEEIADHRSLGNAAAINWPASAIARIGDTSTATARPSSP